MKQTLRFILSSLFGIACIVLLVEIKEEWVICPASVMLMGAIWCGASMIVGDDRKEE